ncbi:lysylphosphatidylglycerol synthase domain-containing protein [Prochlorococcus sp. MIT 1300]|uniref:lysylphosphatidylglycerol synthase domain-containing protein n=1 Tax=Prochlorococcus sp. MIT 1300 TaxID=3096218 RepID=UPI002A7501BA|nr:lysylphosphatidylglycerol synthase domain-containing protein [Prochlorococcus sp. MIT 1300]
MGILRLVRSLITSFASLSIPGGLSLWTTLLSIFFVLFVLSNNAKSFFELNLDATGFIWLLLALIVSMLSLLVNSFAWSLLVLWLGHKPKRLSIISLFLSTNLMKYLPGGIWHFLERVRLLKLYMRTSDALSSVLFEPILMAVAALLWVPFGGWQAGLSLICFLPAFLLTPNLRQMVLNKVQSLKVKQLEIVSEENLGDLVVGRRNIGPANYPFIPLAFEMIFVLIRFCGFWFCLLAFSISSELPIGQWLAAFSLAWTVGLIVPGAPGGVGVFEATLLLRIGSLVSDAQLIGVMLCYRLVVTFADLLSASAVLLGRRLCKRLD